jgi:hypothetical protein
MSQNPLRRLAETLNLPNWAAGGVVFAIVLLFIASVVALSTGSTPSERVQMIYQLALVIAGLIGLPLAIWRSWTAHRQAETGLKQLEGLQRQISLAERGAEADRLQKGAELLQADGMAVRVAGVAILSEIARDKTHRYRNEAIEVLASFLRSRSEEVQRGRGGETTGSEDVHRVFSTLTLLRGAGTSVNFGSVYITGTLVFGLNFEGYDFLNSKFKHVSFQHCIIPPEAGPEFTDCDFGDCEIQFGAISLTAYKRCTMLRCKLIGVVERQVFDAMELDLNECDTSQLTISP